MRSLAAKIQSSEIVLQIFAFHNQSWQFNIVIQLKDQTSTISTISSIAFSSSSYHQHQPRPAAEQTVEKLSLQFFQDHFSDPVLLSALLPINKIIAFDCPADGATASEDIFVGLKGKNIMV